MGEEKMKILEMLKDGKITAEEAHGLLEDLEEGEVVEMSREKGIRVKSGKDGSKEELGPVGFWINWFFFALLPMLLAFALGGLIIYGLFFYLPTHTPPETMWVVYGLIGVLILCATLIIYGVVVGALRRGIGLAKSAIEKDHLLDLAKLKKMKEEVKEESETEKDDD